ncbi:homoserine dehydrogenase [Sesbania bispinosa]|nr:homoserine dehydrogenase [Sesbania bispinosa]
MHTEEEREMQLFFFLFQTLKLGDAGVIEGTYNYFQWADEGVGEEECMQSEYAIEELKLKNAKLKFKLLAERKAGRMNVFCCGCLGCDICSYRLLCSEM